MVKQSWQLFFCLAFMLLSTALMVWTYFPDKQNETEVLIAPFEFEELDEAGFYPISTRLVFHFPDSIKLGKISRLGVITQLEDLSESQTFIGTDIRQTHNVLIETRLELYPAQVSPGETIKQPANSSSQYEFIWTVELLEELQYKGDIWVYFHFVPKAGGDVLKKPVCAFPLEIDSKTLMGISVSGVRRISLAGFILASILAGFGVRGMRRGTVKIENTALKS